MSFKIKKLTLAINGLRYGGMERQLIEFVRVLHAKDIRISLMALNKPGPLSDIVRPYLDSDIMYFDRRKSRIPITVFKIWKLLRQNRPDIIHVQDNFTVLYMLLPAKLLRIPLVNGAIRHAGVTHGLTYLTEKLLLQMSELIVANSKAGLDYFKLNNGIVMYNLIDLHRFHQSKGDLNTIVMNANFHHLKDYTTFFTAIRKLYDNNRVVKVGVIGDGPTKPFYQKLVEEWGIADKITFYGFVNNVEDILTEYGIGVLSSTKKYKEGVSNSLLEYMASGLIAIGSDVGGTAEIITDKVSGMLFEVENPESLYKAIEYIQDHPEKRESLISAAAEHLKQKHTPENNVNMYLNMLDRWKK